jgi:hypothetical protein
MKQMYVGDQEDLRAKLWSLDLEPIIFKLMDEDDGEGWSQDQALAAAEEYRRFLFLTVTSPATIVPTKFVDVVWHTHILDTMKYADDCQKLFGFFLHHFPYFGMRGEEDNANLQKAFRGAADIYEEAFGQPYYVGINGASCGTCGSNACGSCAGSGITRQVDIVRSNIRPSLAMAAA